MHRIEIEKENKEKNRGQPPCGVLDTASRILISVDYLIPEILEVRLALESIPEIRMFISQFHPRSQPAVFILVVFFQKFLTAPLTGL